MLFRSFAEPIAKGKQHLFFKEDVGPDGRRRFTDAHTCLVFEYAARDMEEGVVPYSLLLYIDGTSQWRNVQVLPVYITSRNYDKSIQNRPTTWHLLACIPILKKERMLASLSKEEKTYRGKQVSILSKYVHACL